jgi:hypothetical protein
MTIEQRRTRRLIRDSVFDGTPMGILTLPGFADDDDVDYYVEAFRQASEHGHPWPPVIVAPDVEFTVTAQRSRRYQTRRLLLALQGGPRC